ncbi:hypothetical protein GCM10025875_14380 [Litorihabitans aurantiacus]|uniref:RCK C-terminal domain-containing protein n=1 Tax=Litorihabitans aurantiacus TaxID=1930061 RepID=A0AA37XE17_9MICO|nr:hypothetical protein GCM10025875_14380 [Litorihabitans aurantiacus]
MTALVEEAVSVGDVVKLFELQASGAGMYEVTLAQDAPLVGSRVAEVPWPTDVVLATILRSGRAIPPSPDDTLEGGDQLVFVIATPPDDGVLSAPETSPARALQELLDAPAAT